MKGIVKNDRSPHARRRAIGLDSVKWTTGGFWSERYRRVKEVTVPWLWQCVWDPEMGNIQQYLDTFAHKREGNLRGSYWHDEILHKTIESAVYLLAYEYDPELDRLIDEAAGKLAEVQREDGYLVLTQPRHHTKFKIATYHELYNMGHLITAGCVHYHLTGKTNLLDVARKAADCIYNEFALQPEQYPNFSATKSYIMAVIDLYRVTGMRKYLDLAGVLIDLHGRKVVPGSPKMNGVLVGNAEIALALSTSDAFVVRNLLEQLKGSDARQSKVPLREEKHVVGHAVNFEYLYCSATDFYMETGDRELREAVLRLWDDLHHTKIAVHGGVSPFQRALTIRGDSATECVGEPYDIPNFRSYHETCSQIGNAMWNWRLLLAEGEAKYADMMELEMYNATISSVSLEGTHWFYINPTKWLAEHELKHDPKHSGERSRPCHAPGYSHTCCPTNLTRFEAQMHGYMYTLESDAADAAHTVVCVDHYGANVLDVEVKGGKIVLEQETDYPWDGKVQIRLKEVPNGVFSLKLRIPSWCADGSVAVNQESCGKDLPPNTYVVLERMWRSGDEIELDLPMKVQYLRSHPKLDGNNRHVAVRRGPVIYCLETCDLPAGASINQVRLPLAAGLRPVYKKELLGGVVALEGELCLEEIPDYDGPLYSAWEPTPMKRVAAQLIPYYVWSNRGESEMSVWLPYV
jgi:DUF1680 family protein